jgi:hypothetical protein
VVFTSMSGNLALGIFDQGVWLLSPLKDPFVTIRGLPLFGDHASYILVLVAPLYWLWPDPRLLLQAVGLASLPVDRHDRAQGGPLPAARHRGSGQLVGRACGGVTGHRQHWL